MIPKKEEPGSLKLLKSTMINPGMAWALEILMAMEEVILFLAMAGSKLLRILTKRPGNFIMNLQWEQPVFPSLLLM